jgi:hypothetical protein
MEWVVVGFTRPLVDGERVGVGKEASPTVRGLLDYEGVVYGTEGPAKAGIPVEGP